VFPMVVCRGPARLIGDGQCHEDCGFSLLDALGGGFAAFFRSAFAFATAAASALADLAFSAASCFSAFALAAAPAFSARFFAASSSLSVLTWAALAAAASFADNGGGDTGAGGGSDGASFGAAFASKEKVGSEDAAAGS